MKYTLWAIALLTLPGRSLAQWTQLQGPEWGIGWALAQNGEVIYTATAEKLYKSIDEGFHWEKLDCPTELMKNVFKMLATGGGIFVQTYDQQLFRSLDEGKTWTLIMDKNKLGTLTGRTKYDFFVHENIVLIGDDRYILASKDGGDHWHISEDLISQELTRFFEFKGEFFAWGGTYVYRSSDGGLTWEKVYSTLGNILTINVVQNKIHLLYKNFDRIVKTANGFRNWETVFPNETFETYIDAGHISPVFFSNSNSTLYLLIHSTLYCKLFVYASSDGGDNWVELSDSLGINLSLTNFAIFVDHLILGHRHGLVAIGYNFKQPVQMSAGIFDTSPVWIGELGNQKFLSDQNQSFVSKDDGQSWVQIFPEYNPGCYRYKKITGVTRKRAVSTQINSFSLSEDGGTNWTGFPTAFPVRNAICSGDRIWCHDNLTLFMLEDGSANPVMVEKPPGHSLHSSTFASYDGGMILHIADGPYFIYDNSGAIIKSIPPSTCYELPYGLKKVLYDGHTLYYFCNEHTYVFKENATEWEELFPEDPQNSSSAFYRSIKFAEYFDGIIWIGTSTHGLFFSTDHGQHFYPYFPPFPDFVPISMQKIGDKFWIGVESNGIFITDLPLMKQHDMQEAEFKISPNPSSFGYLAMESNLFLKSESNLELFDVSGRRVAVLSIASGQQWGIHFPGLALGVYYVKLTTEAGVRTLKWTVYR